jgi:hypothetical protein
MKGTHPTLLAFGKALASALDEGFLALYVLDEPASGTSAIGRIIPSAWILTASNPDLRAVRRTYRMVCSQLPLEPAGGPAVISAEEWPTYLRLFPDRARTLLGNFRLIQGKPVLHEWEGPEPVTTLTSLARVAAESLLCSALVVGEHLSLERQADLHARLRLTADDCLGRAPVRPHPVDNLIALHAYLDSVAGTWPDFAWDGSPPTDAPARLPGLISLYSLGNQLVVVMARLDRPVLQGTDWGTVAELVSTEYENIVLATPWQLRLTGNTILAADLTAGSFEHVWGIHLLADCCPSDSQVVASLISRPVQFLAERLPALYSTTAEADLSALAHDLQNILLNSQLQAEVIARRWGMSLPHPPGPLPGHEAPIHDRMVAIERQFRWWAHRPAQLPSTDPPG